MRRRRRFLMSSGWAAATLCIRRSRLAELRLRTCLYILFLLLLEAPVVYVVGKLEVESAPRERHPCGRQTRDDFSPPETMTFVGAKHVSDTGRFFGDCGDAL